MNEKHVLVLNSVAKEGLALFGDGYKLVKDTSFYQPDAIIVRSARVETDEYPNLLAVARAGAGVNTISVDKATQKGVCVFNTPGANANAVAELVFYMLGVYARRIGLTPVFKTLSLNVFERFGIV